MTVGTQRDCLAGNETSERPERAIGIMILAAGLAAATAAAPAAADGPRPWDLSLRAFGTYDDNVALTSDATGVGGTEDTFGVGSAVSGVYRLVQTSAWQAGLGGSAFYNRPLSTPSFRSTGFSPNAFASYRTGIHQMPLRIDGAFSLSRDWVGGDPFSSAFSPNVSATLQATDRLLVSTSLGARFSEFQDDGALPEETSRDGTAYTAGLSGTYQLGAGWPNLTLGYAYAVDNTDGTDFVTEAHQVNARVDMPLPYAALLSVGGQYARVNYPDFSTSPGRQQDNYQVQTTLTVPVGREVSVDVNHVYNLNTSNIASFDTSRNQVTFGVSYRF